MARPRLNTHSSEPMSGFTFEAWLVRISRRRCRCHSAASKVVPLVFPARCCPESVSPSVLVSNCCTVFSPAFPLPNPLSSVHLSPLLLFSLSRREKGRCPSSRGAPRWRGGWKEEGMAWNTAARAASRPS
eukprot:scaffold49364_cov44-Tisochrysis_lutea.AAC.1